MFDSRIVARFRLIESFLLKPACTQETYTSSLKVSNKNTKRVEKYVPS